MDEMETYASYAVLQELSRREFRKKLDLFPAELRHHVILAAGIIGAENAKRIEETPEAVVKDGEDFASDLLNVVNPDQDDAFKGVLETYLIETMKDELRFCCSNCVNFNACIDLKNLSVGHLFKELTEGRNTDELKNEIAIGIGLALRRVPHLEAVTAHMLCKDFEHQYTASSIGSVFNRYADIAAALQQSFGIDYRRIQQEMITLNMDFYAKHQEQ